MKRAAEFYRAQAAAHGGYVYYYALDFSERWGEGKATVDQIFIQPPGTPAVGMAFLKAHTATGDKAYLAAAQAAAEALVAGSLNPAAGHRWWILIRTARRPAFTAAGSHAVATSPRSTTGPRRAR